MTTRQVTLVGYAVILALAIAWGVVAARSTGWMTLPDAWRALTRRRVVRFVLLAAWVWLGWHLFARGSGAFD
jgi:Family of unknown function (DUF6186)